MAAAVTAAPMPTAPEQFTPDAPSAVASTLTGDAGTTHLKEKEQEVAPTANGAANGNGLADHSIPHSEPAPSQVDLRKVADLSIYTQDGKEEKFSSLYAQDGKHLIIFVRHFLCGLCEDYVRAVAKDLPPSALPPNTTLHLIGNGEYTTIAPYIQRTACPYPVLANPDRKIYDGLGMMSNLNMGNVRPKYQIRGVVAQALDGIKYGLGHMGEAMKVGKISQLGGELLLETHGGSTQVKWAHWMKTTRGHAEIAEVKKVLGLA